MRPFGIQCLLVTFNLLLMGVSAHAAELMPVMPSGATLADWQEERTRLLGRWQVALGVPDKVPPSGAARQVEEFTTPDFRGILYLQPTGDTMMKVLLMVPLGWKTPTAGVVVPFYDPDRMCGYNLKTKERLGPERNTAFFALHLVRQGYVVAACEAYPFNLLKPEEQAAAGDGFGGWKAAAVRLKLIHPHWTGVGKLTHDTRRALDLLATSGFADPQRLGLMGHSLGGKMAFYAGCLDERVKAFVASDFGIGWDFSNWSDEWYFGPKLKAMRADGLAMHQLLACAAPRSFFLIAGQYDHVGSTPYLAAARPVHALYPQPGSVELFNHHSGHQPTYDSLRAAYAWLARELAMPNPDLAFMAALEGEQAKAAGRSPGR